MPPTCTTCPLRARYDRNPGSLLGRLWRWHATWCPGWKKYLTYLPQSERDKLIKKYKLTQFRER
jgi:hypothetical protein